jgi:hypothetical protein
LQLVQTASDAQLTDVVHRYDTFMQNEEGSPEIAPSVEFDIIWRVHRLSPAAYASVRIFHPIALAVLAAFFLILLLLDDYAHDSDGHTLTSTCNGVRWTVPRAN